ncbi:MAG: hypothetical protein ABFD98_00730 [Syntrophobacteraceae bacterium]|nr:hypothetical protein [Desulfobacteraceae bacterium]
MTEIMHTFHIPVMGTAFTIESPLKVAKFGISSVISCVDDTLIERMRKFYCRVTGQEYSPIRKYDHDARANRTTAYLNLVDQIVKEQLEKLKASAFELGEEITKYFELLPDNSSLKQMYKAMLLISNAAERKKLQDELRERIRAGFIDVNIMTKLDRTNFDAQGEALPGEFTDAMASLRGFANSNLDSSIVFSAGFNGRLYGYVEQFPDFHADENGFIKKKIVIKVNDYRSAFTQGKFFAKKALWVSEYRLESGLNCGGHAFGHGGNLMGPSLEEFRQRKDELIGNLFDIYNKALAHKGKKTFDKPHPVRITAQGGVGTHREHAFLLDYYKVDAVGWGTPFLLVPEATTTDPEMLEKLCRAGEKDLFLSDVSPLGVPFSNLRDSASELARNERIAAGKPGSRCSKGHLAMNTEFTEIPVCTASEFYQKKKIEQLQGMNLDEKAYREAYEAITQKACLCNDLGGAAMLTHELREEEDRPSHPAVCPGPNLAYFTGPYTLEQMIDHIYGRRDLLDGVDRPNMFISELGMNIDFLEWEITQAGSAMNDQKVRYFREFRDTLRDGMDYYESLVPKMSQETEEYKERMHRDLRGCREALDALIGRHPALLS